MDFIHNERIKLAATAFNNAGVATFAAGILGPTIGYVYGTSGVDTGGWWLMIGIVWFLVGAALSSMGWITLGLLRP